MAKPIWYAVVSPAVSVLTPLSMLADRSAPPGTACASGAEVDSAKLASPAKLAVSVWSPEPANTSWQLPEPALSVARQLAPLGAALTWIDPPGRPHPV